MKTYLASLAAAVAAFTAGFLGMMRALSKAEDVEWTDDGVCACPDASLHAHDTCPDRRPSGQPLSPLLLTYQQELWVP